MTDCISDCGQASVPNAGFNSRLCIVLYLSVKNLPSVLYSACCCGFFWLAAQKGSVWCEYFIVHFEVCYHACFFAHMPSLHTREPHCYYEEASKIDFTY